MGRAACCSGQHAQHPLVGGRAAHRTLLLGQPATGSAQLVHRAPRLRATPHSASAQRAPARLTPPAPHAAAPTSTLPARTSAHPSLSCQARKSTSRSWARVWIRLGFSCRRCAGVCLAKHVPYCWHAVVRRVVSTAAAPSAAAPAAAAAAAAAGAAACCSCGGGGRRRLRCRCCWCHARACLCLDATDHPSVSV